MKRIAAILLCLAVFLTGCADDAAATDALSTGQIYLYGESHGAEAILNRELELWRGHYNNGLRHLFVELSHFTAAFLNLWMQADDDAILDALFSDWEGTSGHTPYALAFYQAIKRDCPETVFHGTDVGHQYDTTGARYLAYLAENDLTDSPAYALAEENIAQGIAYYKNKGNVYRENTMSENFIRAFDALNGASIMGIYGAAHTALDGMDYQTQSVPCMANQLKARYGETVHTEDLSYLAKITTPERMDVITVAGKDYDAAYFGEYDLIGFQNFKSRAFWRLENAYDDCNEKPTTGDVLPTNNYPMAIETGQVFVIDYTMTDGTVMRLYYRADGDMWNGMPSTVGFTAE